MTQTSLNWHGKTLNGSDGKKIGKIDDVYQDTSSGQPLFATVKVGLLGGKTSFVPITAATVQGDELQVPYTKDLVGGSPQVSDDGEISAAEEQDIYAYYGLGGGRSAGADYAGGRHEHRVDEHRVDEGRVDEGRVDEGRLEGGVEGGTVGHDTSGPNTDDAMTRSEERLHVGTEQVETGRARLRKYIVTENVTQTVPISHEEVRVEREPITEANRDAAYDGPDLSEEEHEVTLRAERPVVAKETVPVERVRLGTETVTNEAQVDEQVRHEEIDQVDDSTGSRDQH